MAQSPGLTPNASFSALNYVLFAFLCLFWGSTWIALKTGVAALPPFFFASTRFGAAGLLLFLATLATREFKKAHWRLVGEILLPTILMISVNYGLMAWGLTRVSLGVSAVVNLSTVALSTNFFSMVWGQTPVSPARIASLGLGVSGLGLLFLPGIQAAPDAPTWVGILAIAAGACCYGAGSVLLRERSVDAPPRVLSALQSMIGGGALFLFTLWKEPIHASTWSALVTPPVFWGWVFLVLVGSVLAFTLYLTLLPRWGAARVASYAFICPVIALAEGMLFAGEKISTLEGAATLVLLSATWLGLRLDGK
ncbi:MAG TPA: EamA family transporter [bacterium]|nr:EamA family transporter [bacterium]